MRSQKLIWAMVGLLLCAVAGLAILQLRARQQIRAINRTTRQITYELGEALDWRDRSEVGLQVGAIQFLRTGYSIQLESAEYGADGLTLAGEIGNPTQLWVSNVTVNFTAATPYGFDEWMRSKPNSLVKVVGTGQSSIILTLAPGKTARFLATIPNLKQTPGDPNQPTIFVNFSGERYSYSP